ncbi:MAG TPA: hypothetical protein VF086_09565 [Propionibacteriaceae bacterium]
MTAEAEQAAAAAAALDLGMQLSAQYHDAAGASPGDGLAVALPSALGPIGPVQGLNFGYLDGPVLRKPDQGPRLVPSYGVAEVVGGLGHHAATPGGSAGLDGVAWPSRADAPSRSTIYVGRGSTSKSAPSRVKQARNRVRRSLRGRSGK